MAQESPVSFIGSATLALAGKRKMSFPRPNFETNLGNGGTDSTVKKECSNSTIIDKLNFVVDDTAFSSPELNWKTKPNKQNVSCHEHRQAEGQLVVPLPRYRPLVYTAVPSCLPAA